MNISLLKSGVDQAQRLKVAGTSAKREEVGAPDSEKILGATPLGFVGNALIFKRNDSAMHLWKLGIL